MMMMMMMNIPRTYCRMIEWHVILYIAYLFKNYLKFPTKSKSAKIKDYA